MSEGFDFGGIVMVTGGEKEPCDCCSNKNWAWKFSCQECGLKVCEKCSCGGDKVICPYCVADSGGK